MLAAVLSTVATSAMGYRRRAAALTGVLACAATLAAGFSTGPAHAAGPPAQSRAAVAARYLAIAQPANRRLDSDFALLDARDHETLRAATAALRDVAAAERRFDRQLLSLPLPPRVRAVARLTVDANAARANLTTQAAGSTSPAGLRGYEARLMAANSHVEEAVHVIRDQLGLPPPAAG